MENVLYDLTIIGSDSAIPSMPIRSGGVIIEPEKLQLESVRAFVDDSNKLSAGAAIEAVRDGDPIITFSVDATHSGMYFMEIRYARKWGNLTQLPVTVNGEINDEPFVAWQTGGNNSWMYDAVSISLNAGQNTVSFPMHHSLLLDQIRVVSAAWE